MLEIVCRKGNFLHCWWECKLIQPLWNTVQRFLKNLGIKLTYDPTIPLLGISTIEIKTEKDTWTSIFIATLFTVTRIWKQPKCSTTVEWIKSCAIFIQWNISHTKEHSWVNSSEVNEPRVCFTEWIKSEGEKKFFIC